MILLDRQESEQHKILRRIHAGFAGEQRVDAEWLEIIVPHPHYFLHDLQILNQFGTTHQIDTVLLCPQFILILEIKNVTGFLEFDESFNQFTRTTAEGDVEGMTNPLHQSRRHMEWVKGMLQHSRLEIPVHYAVVLATKNAILSKSLRGQPIFHVSGLRYQVRELLQQHKETQVEEEKLFQFASKLLSMYRPINREIEVPARDIVKGVLCERCLNGQTMNYRYPKWYCQRCGAVDQEAIFRTLEDYRLLVGETLTNKSFCEFFAIDSPNTAYKLLQKLPLKAEGTKLNRKYLIVN